MNLRLIWLVSTALFIALMLIRYAHAHDPEGHNAYSQWFITQLQNNGVTPCCGQLAGENGGDAHYVEVKPVGDQYYVNIDGNWVLYPHKVNPYLENPTGHNVVWYSVWTAGDGKVTYTFYCLRLSTGA